MNDPVATLHVVSSCLLGPSVDRHKSFAMGPEGGHLEIALCRARIASPT